MKLAHDGHSHDEPETAHLITSEPAVGATNYLGDVLLNMLPFAVLLIIVLFMTYVIKSKKTTIVNVALIYLLLAGLTTYSVAPVASIISLILGFGLALIVVLGRVKN
jgi:hypothetical protein